MEAIARDVPGPGQESTWDYPRPPRVEPSTEEVRVTFGGEVVAHTRAALRVLETSHPPVYYLPREAFLADVLRATPGTSYCEFKGVAAYLDVQVGGRRAERAAWFYPRPTSPYALLREHVAVYPGLMDAVTVDGEPVRAQEGNYYGGWITSRVVGPFKGAPGTRTW